jgi:AAA+ ATPase superfamily predicted ATPase
MNAISNPFRPGAGHQPPYLAGREAEKTEFTRLGLQDVVLENLVLTGLRGVGKTVLLEQFKPIAQSQGWLWVGADLSESATLTEERIATRLITDISVVTSSIAVQTRTITGFGFTGEDRTAVTYLNYPVLKAIYDQTPGLVHDKLRAVLVFVGETLNRGEAAGIIFAYDEAQNLADQSVRNEYPLSLLLDVFQSIQRAGYRLMLVLTGLPTLFPTLVESRTFAERMFRVMFLQKLDEQAAREAITRPLDDVDHPLRLDNRSINIVVNESGGYPYFIQFICREVYDIFLRQEERGEDCQVPVEEIVRKLDTDFFAGRWARATDRQRELLALIAELPNCDSEFSVQEIVDQSRANEDIRAFSSSHVNQMLLTLSKNGLVFKNRHGRYSFAVPLLGQYIRRQTES